MTSYHPLRVVKTLAISILVFGFLVAPYSERAQAESAKLSGTFAPGGIVTNLDGSVDWVILKVQRGWISSENFTIAVNVVSFNNDTVDHGTMTVELSTAMFDDPNTDVVQGTATIAVPWTLPPIPHTGADMHCGTTQVFSANGQLFTSAGTPDAPICPNF